MQTIAGRQYLDETEACDFLGYRNRLTLYRARLRGKVSYYKIGGRVLYSEEFLRAYMDQHLIPAREPKQAEQTRRTA